MYYPFSDHHFILLLFLLSFVNTVTAITEVFILLKIQTEMLAFSIFSIKNFNHTRTKQKKNNNNSFEKQIVVGLL